MITNQRFHIKQNKRAVGWWWVVDVGWVGCCRNMLKNEKKTVGWRCWWML